MLSFKELSLGAFSVALGASAAFAETDDARPAPPSAMIDAPEMPGPQGAPDSADIGPDRATAAAPELLFLQDPHSDIRFTLHLDAPFRALFAGPRPPADHE